jgi:hypothetical protein
LVQHRKRYYICQWNTYTHANPHTDCDSNAEPNSKSYIDPDAYCHSDANPHTDCDCNPNPDPNAEPNSESYTNTDSDPNPN